MWSFWEKDRRTGCEYYQKELLTGEFLFEETFSRLLDASPAPEHFEGKVDKNIYTMG